MSTSVNARKALFLLALLFFVSLIPPEATAERNIIATSYDEPLPRYVNPKTPLAAKNPFITTESTHSSRAGKVKHDDYARGVPNRFLPGIPRIPFRPRPRIPRIPRIRRNPFSPPPPRNS